MLQEKSFVGRQIELLNHLYELQQCCHVESAGENVIRNHLVHNQMFNTLLHRPCKCCDFYRRKSHQRIIMWPAF